MPKALVGVIVGTRADFNIMRRGLESLRVMGVPYRFELSSPHKSPDQLAQLAQSFGEDGVEILICAAGGSAQVASFLANYTTLPIIAVPIDSSPLRGQDALYSMVQQPPGTPVATVGVNSGENAAILATEILALKYPRYRTVLSHARGNLAQRLESSQKELLSVYPELVDPVKTIGHRADPTPGDEDTDPGIETEGETPEPGEHKRERIRPGAILVRQEEGAAERSASKAGQLVQTPIPQEPGTITDDPEWREDGEVASGDAAPDASDFPPPPLDDDLSPLELESFPSFNELSPDTRNTPPDPLALEEKEREQEREGTSRPNGKTIETKVFSLDRSAPDEDVLTHAMMVLLEGGIVAFPTDTVYGLAVDATSPEAVELLYHVKGHNPQHKSLSVLIHKQEMLDELVKEVPPPVEPVLGKYWPGGLTVLFPKHPSVLSSVSEAPSIAIRIPNDSVALGLMEMVGRPLAVINAALRDAAPAVSADEVLDRFLGKIDCVLDAGPCQNQTASTVLSVLTDPFEILRDGAIPPRDLQKLLGEKLKTPPPV